MREPAPGGRVQRARIMRQKGVCVLQASFEALPRIHSHPMRANGCFHKPADKQGVCRKPHVQRRIQRARIMRRKGVCVLQASFEALPRIHPFPCVRTDIFINRWTNMAFAGTRAWRTRPTRKDYAAKGSLRFASLFLKSFRASIPIPYARTAVFINRQTNRAFAGNPMSKDASNAQGLCGERVFAFCKPLFEVLSRIHPFPYAMREQALA